MIGVTMRRMIAKMKLGGKTGTEKRRCLCLMGFSVDWKRVESRL